MKIKEINIKEGFPPADVAVALLEIEIESLKNTEYGAIKVIHGYGSHGKGGEIRKLLRFKLADNKKKKIIYDFIEGEKWSNEIVEKYKIIENFPELLLKNDINCYNSGVTIIFLKEFY